MPPTWSEPAFADVAALLARHAGLRLPPTRFADLEAATRRQLAATGLGSVAAFAAALREERVSFEQLVGDLTVGETYFFRDPGQFDLIAQHALPELARQRGPSHALRAWSAGCASGEEPYSLAMLFAERGTEHAPVLGTDISRPALARARAGVYRDWSLRGPARDRARAHLRPHGADWAIPRELQRRVHFEYLNLAEDAWPSLATGTEALDLILCRNVLIYFDDSVIAAVARRLFAALADGGYLLTAASDPPLGEFAPWERVASAAGVVYRRAPEGAQRRTRDARTPARAPATLPSAAAPPARAVPLSTRAAPAAPGPTAAPEPTAAPARTGREPSAVDRARGAYARGDYAEALALQSDLLDASTHAAGLAVRAAANLGQLATAEQLATEATRRHPLDPEAHFLRAAVLAERGRDADAAAALERVLYLDRTLAVAHFALGLALDRLGRRGGARRALESARKLCAALPRDAPLPLGDGQRAGRLAEVAAAQLAVLGNRS